MNNREKYKKISLNNFIESFGARKKDFDKKLLRYIKSNNFDFIEVQGKEKIELINKINSQLDKKIFSKSGKKRFKDWNSGWKENYDEYIKSNFKSEKLIPKYIHGDRPVRWKKNFIIPKKKFIEWRFSTVFRSWLFKKYFKNVDEIFDFGTGTACHLELLSKIYPKKKITGLDWSPYSIKIINLLRKKKNLNIFGKKFNFFNINNSLKIPNNSAILTYGALEQVGTEHKKFINFLIKKKPKICVHVECMNEMYDVKNKVDNLGHRYHLQRGYLKDFLKNLLKLQKIKKIKILKVKRLYFGSYYQEVYNYVIWQPL